MPRADRKYALQILGNGYNSPLNYNFIYSSYVIFAQNTSWGAACLPAYPARSNVSAADIVTILKAHNDYRRKVAQGLETQGSPGPQPPASNMREMVCPFLQQ